MTPQEFIQKWQGHALTERASAQSHFNDLCKLVGEKSPVEADRTGEEYAFEKGVSKTGGGEGFADVWKRGHFAFEYKKTKSNLDKALEQLTRYASALENPPLHVACDTNRFKIVTAWTNTVPKVYEFALADIGAPENLKLLHALFSDPNSLRPQKTRASLTKEAADKFSAIVERLQHRNQDREAVAHFVNQLVFCFFAEDVKLLPEDYFTKLLHTASKRPKDAKKMLDGLFAAMDRGGTHGIEDIAHFNGGLFDGRPSLELDHGDIGLLAALGSMDWSLIDPMIFGTLFERFLDPDKRAQIGAHYTDETKIMMIVEPVVMRPLLAEWAQVKARIAALLDGTVKPGKGRISGRTLKPLEAAEAERGLFLDRLRSLRILDPACGSGNFLYLALHAVKDIENRAILETEAMGLSSQLRQVGPEILLGIEINPYAAELAQTTVWIGYIQWKIRNAVFGADIPILKKLNNIECRDALVTRLSDADGNEMFVEAVWPEAEFIVGNPPFLGGKKLIADLGASYTETLRKTYAGRVDRFSDLVCWWFEKARAQITAKKTKRAGLVSTNSIRGGANRRTLDKLALDTRVFEAWSDEPWVVDGAAVRVSIICFEAADGKAPAFPLAVKVDAERTDGGGAGSAEGAESGRSASSAPTASSSPPPSVGSAATFPARGKAGATPLTRLDGREVEQIFSDLTAGLSDLTHAKRLRENDLAAFIGVQKTGPFDIDDKQAISMLCDPVNVNGRPNSDVIKPYVNGSDIVRGWRRNWIVDFGLRTEDAARQYENPFEYSWREVRPVRLKNSEAVARDKWWVFWRPRPELSQANAGLARFIATPRVSKHRIFDWQSPAVCLDSAAIAIARDDDTAFGILHSRFHEAWSLRLGTWLGVGNDPRYTPTTTFETFPFPQGLTPDIKAADYADDPRAERIAAAARELDEKRLKWLNPPDLVDIVPEIIPTAVPGEAPVKYPDRILPKNAEAAQKLQERTLTKLYNARPQWLASLHEALDRAVAAAYGWPEDISTDEALARLLALNLERAAAGR
jgi:type II restriction/modification system DNA methylase subunit YeeA